MPINQRALIEALATLSDEENLKVTATESAKGGLLVGISAAVGGVLLGPVGLAVGGAVGGLCAYGSSKGKFLPVATVIRQMPVAKQRQLLETLQFALRDINILDLAPLLFLLQRNMDVRQIALDVVRNYVSSNMGLTFA